MAVHHCQLIHFANSNSSNNERIAIAIRFSKKSHVDKKMKEQYVKLRKKIDLLFSLMNRIVV